MAVHNQMRRSLISACWSEKAACVVSVKPDRPAGFDSEASHVGRERPTGTRPQARCSRGATSAQSVLAGGGWWSILLLKALQFLKPLVLQLVAAEPVCCIVIVPITEGATRRGKLGVGFDVMVGPTRCRQCMAASTEGERARSLV